MNQTINYIWTRLREDYKNFGVINSKILTTFIILNMPKDYKGQGGGSINDEQGVSDILMLLYTKHPVYFICFACLALYGLSMMAFY